MKKFLTFAVLIFLVSATTIAEKKPGEITGKKSHSVVKSISLSGTIEDAENSEKLVCAMIEIEKLGLKTFTDIEGNFEISNLTSGDYTLKISYISYQEIEISTDELSHKSVLNIKLKPL